MTQFYDLFLAAIGLLVALLFVRYTVIPFFHTIFKKTSQEEAPTTEE
jgi:hypothetical protein